jgi:hypothetical protein
MIEYGTADAIYWDAAYMEARFTVRVNEAPMLCRVSYEAIADHYGAQHERECLALAQRHFNEIINRSQNGER